MKFFFTGVVLSMSSITLNNAATEKNKIRMDTISIFDNQGELICNPSDVLEPLKIKSKSIKNVCIEKITNLWNLRIKTE